MIVLDPTLLSTIFALPVSLISYAVFRASRSARRNREDRCGNCDGPLYAPGALAGPSLLQGHLICEPCAAKERRNLRRGLIAAVHDFDSDGSWHSLPSPCGRRTSWVPTLDPVVAGCLEYPALFAGAIAWMKRANRRAAHRLGPQPGLALEAANHSMPALTAGGIATYGGGRADA